MTQTIKYGVATRLSRLPRWTGIPTKSVGKTMRVLLHVIACACAVRVVFGAAPVSGSEPAVAIIRKECGTCHGTSAMSGLSVLSRESLLKGGQRGAAIVPGKRSESLLYKAVLRDGELKMPPGKQSLSESD